MILTKENFCSQLSVKKRINETTDTISLVFDVPTHLKDKFKYKAGQFVTLFMDIHGEEVRRSYSIPTSPDYDQEFKITIKLVPGGKGSTYIINNVKVGDQLWVTPPAGIFCLPTDLQNSPLAFFAAGSGITPVISLIKSALKLNSDINCALLYQNKIEDSIIFKSELNQLLTEFAPRLIVEHILTCPDNNWAGACGRVDDRYIRDFLVRNQLGIKTRHFMCGPEGFMSTIKNTLVDLGIDKSKIIFESFFNPGQASRNTSDEGVTSSTKADNSLIPDEAISIGDPTQISTPEKIEALIDGETHTVDCKKDMTVLECLLDAGLNPPYSCLDGACMACLAKVESGIVYQENMGILTDDNVEAKECLTCQARPASKTVKINYDHM